MGFIPVAKYLIGLGFFGFLYWLLDGILPLLAEFSQTDQPYELLWFLWYGGALAYLLFASWWLIDTYTDFRYHFPGGGGDRF